MTLPGEHKFRAFCNNTSTNAATVTTGILAVAGTYSSTGKGVRLNGGLFGTNGTLTALSNTSNGVFFANNATSTGLFAYGSNATWGNAANNLTLNFSDGGVTWNGTGTSFISSTKTLILGNALSNGTVELQNAINLNAVTQTVKVDHGVGNTAGGVDAKLSGLLSNGGLTKTGSGTLALLNTANSYAGGTAINAGTLLVGNASGSATGTGAVTLNVGTLASGPVGTITGTVTAASGTTVSPGLIGAGTLTLGALTLNTGSILDFSQNGDLMQVSNALTVTGAGTVSILAPAGLTSNYTLINFGSTSADVSKFALSGAPDSYHLALDTNAKTLMVTIPEPAALGLALLVFLGLQGRRERLKGTEERRGREKGDTAMLFGTGTTVARGE